MITYQDVVQAEERIRSYVTHTLLKRSTYLSSQLGFDLSLKFENMQHTGSFKIRGAANKFLLSRAELMKTGVVAASAGNHAQGVAKMATTLGIKSTIVMPVPTPVVKVQSTKAFGADVVLFGENFDEAYAHAQDLMKERGLTFVHPFDDPLIMAGQGTVGLEIAEDMRELDTVIVPIGGGGLRGGIATAIRHRFPKAKIIGVQTTHSPNVGARVKNPKSEASGKSEFTIAEGIAVKKPSQRVAEYLHTLVDDVVFVSDEEVAQSILVLLEKVKSVVEGAGATSLAALLFKKYVPAPKSKVVAVLSGGNVDVRLIGSIIEHGLALAGRMLGVAIVIDDRPGALNRITDAVAKARGNISQVYHHRNSPHLRIGQTEIELHIETRSPEHQKEIEQALTTAGFHIRRTF
jgi:threonine dehydratase